MKTYTITVNGVAYDVTVEEGSSAAAQAAASAPKAAPKPAPVPAPKAEPAPAPAAPAGAKGGITVASPMPGKILAVKAAVGQAVKRGEPILILEAMKMENDIVAPEDGVVATIDCAVGDAVEAGAVLATLN